MRAAIRADLPAVAAIYAEAVRHGTASFELDPPDLPEITRRWDAVRAAGGPYLVGEIDGRVAGFCYAGPYRARPAYRFTLEDSVYVTSRAQGSGLGSALLSEAIGLAEARGFRQMIAVIGDSANLASQRLHARHGFRHIGTLQSVGHKHGAWRDTVIMQRPLGPGDASPPA